MITQRFLSTASALMLSLFFGFSATAKDIVHDAEFYIIHAQNAERWEAEDKQISERLAELEKKHGRWVFLGAAASSMTRSVIRT